MRSKNVKFYLWQKLATPWSIDVDSSHSSYGLRGVVDIVLASYFKSLVRFWLRARDFLFDVSTVFYTPFYGDDKMPILFDATHYNCAL